MAVRALKTTATAACLAVAIPATATADATGMSWLKSLRDLGVAFESAKATGNIAKGGSAAAIGYLERDNPDVTTRDHATKDGIKGGVQAVANVPSAFGMGPLGAFSAWVYTQGGDVLVEGTVGSNQSVDALVAATVNPHNINVKALEERELKDIQVRQETASQYEASTLSLLTYPTWDKFGAYTNGIFDKAGNVVRKTGAAVADAIADAATPVAEIVVPELVHRGPKPLPPVSIGANDPGWRVIKIESNDPSSTDSGDKTCFQLPASGWREELFKDFYDAFSGQTNCKVTMPLQHISAESEVYEYAFQCQRPRCDTCVNYLSGNPTGPGTGGETFSLEGKIARWGEDWDSHKIRHIYTTEQPEGTYVTEVVLGRCELDEETKAKHEAASSE